jgi:hypothetical protein
MIHVLGTPWAPIDRITCEASSDDSEALVAGRITGTVIPTPVAPEITAAVYDKDGALIGSDTVTIGQGATSWEQNVNLQTGFPPAKCTVRFFDNGPPASG